MDCAKVIGYLGLDCYSFKERGLPTGDEVVGFPRRLGKGLERLKGGMSSKGGLRNEGGCNVECGAEAVLKLIEG